MKYNTHIFLLPLYIASIHGFMQGEVKKQNYLHTSKLNRMNSGTKTSKRSSSLLHGVKQTQYGPLESTTLTDLYKGMDDQTIRDIYFSKDLEQIYIREDKDAVVSGVVNSNPILTNSIIESANKNQISAMIIEEPLNIYTSTLALANGVFEFTIFSVAITILLNIVRAFFRSNGNSNPMGQGSFPFLQNYEDKIVDKSSINITLADWAGSPEVVEECAEIVSYIQNSTAYVEAGAEIPKGILFEGPPGTGKTLLAKAIAGETNATFLSMSGSEFVELYVGMGAAKVRKLFEQARENIPSIVFIDEIDAIGKKRGAANMANTNDEREQTLNQILTEMDGFVQNTGVIVIAATNRKDVLDDALLRPGRFDRLVYVPLPDRASRESMLRLYLKNKNTECDINIPYLADSTGGFSGAQIKNLLNEAAIYAARNGETVITKKNIEDALEKIIVGITKKTDTRSTEARRRIAIHEIGHALIVSYFQNDFELKKVSMKSTYSGVGGYTQFNEYPDVQESGLYTKELLMNRIIVSLGGKAAESLEYGDSLVSVGASEDLKQANQLARDMIEKFGMGNKMVVFSKDDMYPNTNQYSERTLELIDKEVMDIVQHCYDQAKSILMDKFPQINLLATMLLIENVLEGKQVTDIVHGRFNGSLLYE